MASISLMYPLFLAWSTCSRILSANHLGAAHLPCLELIAPRAPSSAPCKILQRIVESFADIHNMGIVYCILNSSIAPIQQCILCCWLVLFTSCSFSCLKNLAKLQRGKFQESGGLEANFVTDDQNWSHLEASFSSSTPDGGPARAHHWHPLGFKNDPLIERQMRRHLADKLIDDKGTVFYGSIRVIGKAPT